MTDAQGIRFLSGGRVEKCRAWIAPRRFEYRSLNWIRQGKILWRRQDGKRCQLSAPMLFWTWPGPLFSYGAIQGQSWDQSWISFKGPLAERLFRSQRIAAVADENVCRPMEPGYASETFDRLLAGLAQPVHPIGRMVNLIESLLLMIREAPPIHSITEGLETEGRLPFSASPLNDRLALLDQAIQADPGKPWDWTEQAKRLCVSEIHFRRLFQKRIGLPPQQYLIRCRLRSAENLLAHTDESVKTIAMTVGYHDAIHFTKTFRQHQGLTPTAYRREVQRYR